MAEWVEVLILGVIEGITEFLPISSTGHLLIAQQWLTVRQSDAFLVAIQGGAVAAVVLVFHERVRALAGAWHDAAARDYLARLVVAFAVTGAGGLLLEAGDVTLPETATPVGVALVVGGVLFLVVERRLAGAAGHHDITWTIAVLVGLAQLLAAVFPGTSRSGATVLVALALGLARPLAIEFTFLLGVPTLLAAGALKLVGEVREGGIASVSWGMLGLGSVASAVSAFLAVRWLLRYVQTHTFEGFGWYRIAAGLAVLALVT